MLEPWKKKAILERPPAYIVLNTKLSDIFNTLVKIVSYYYTGLKYSETS